MYQTFGEFLLRLSAHSELWAVVVIAMMAVTAVALYLFWDVVGRAVSLGARLWNGRTGNGRTGNGRAGSGQTGNGRRE